jgi:tetrahydromethanopterin S-methyltransferase subunit D
MDPIMLIILIAIGGVCIGGGVHFIPVGGAPAAMATATGVGTGTAMLAAGAGMTGLITAASITPAMLNAVGIPESYLVVMMGIAGAIGAMLMMELTMLIANAIYVFGAGVVPASAKVEVDPITGRNQENYVTSGTEGHGVPTVCFVSGMIGALLGGLGGGIVYYAINTTFASLGNSPIISSALAAIIAVAVFFINSVIASYNIGGTIEGFHDPKFKRIPGGIAASLVASVVVGIFVYLITIGGVI